MCLPIAPVGPAQLYNLAKNKICSFPYLLKGLWGRPPSVSAYAHCGGSVRQLALTPLAWPLSSAPSHHCRLLLLGAINLCVQLDR